MTLLVLSLLWLGVLGSQWGWIAGLSIACSVGMIVGRMTR